MELDITHMIIGDDDMGLLSGSVFELGDNAGKITWSNSMQYATEHPLVSTPEDIEEVRDYFKQFGAWDDEERASWTPQEVQALLIQFIAGDIREMEDCEDYEAYLKEAQECTCSGNIYKDGEKWFYSLSR